MPTSSRPNVARDSVKQLALAILSVVLGASASAAARQAEASSDQREARITPVVRACRRASPGVVNISTRKIVQARVGMFGGDLFDHIFPSPMVRRVPVQSIGSGFVLHPAGYIVTNAHVTRRAQSISVTFTDKTKLAATVISSDPSHDLAVLKVEPPKGQTLPFLPLGRSDDLMVGETVIAIGNPMGYANTLTTGVVSATDRTLSFREGVKYTGLIQTDAPINPGNSGGVLLNIRGELIGINTAIRADAQNIGFAIPVDALIAELPGLLDFERMNRVVFGAAIAQRHEPGGDVVFVKAVRAGSPAAKELRRGDRIVALNGRAVRQIPDYSCAMMAMTGGQTVQVDLVRDGKRRRVRVALAARPKPDGKALARALFGVTLRPLTPQLAKDLRLPSSRGLLVVGCVVGGPADRIGVRVKDMLFQVDRFYVKDLEHLGRILEEVRPGQGVKIGIARGNVRAWVTIHTRNALPAPPTKSPKPSERRKPNA